MVYSAYQPHESATIISSYLVWTIRALRPFNFSEILIQSQFKTIGACCLNRKIEYRAAAGIHRDTNEPADLCPDTLFSSSLSNRRIPPFGYACELGKVAATNIPTQASFTERPNLSSS